MLLETSQQMLFIYAGSYILAAVLMSMLFNKKIMHGTYYTSLATNTKMLLHHMTV